MSQGDVEIGLQKVAEALCTIEAAMAKRNQIEERKLQLRIAELEERGVLPNPAKNTDEK